MGTTDKTVASQLIPLGKEHVLLPNTAVAEIIGHTKASPLPDAIKDAPEWLIGMLSWRGMSVPLLSFEAMLGGPLVEAATRARIAVINGIGDNSTVQFFAIATQGIPRLVQVDNDRISTAPDAEPNKAVHCHVIVDGEVAMIPDIDYIEEILAKIFSADRPGNGATNKKASKKK